jgi:uncharacterized paraquat-inducible protein A
MGERACRQCGSRFPKSYERCPRCGVMWTTSWRHKVAVLGLVVVALCILYWVIVRYLLPAHGIVGSIVGGCGR